MKSQFIRFLKSQFAKNLLLLLGALLLSVLLAEFIVYARYNKHIALFPRYVTDVEYGEFRIRRNVPKARYFHKSFDGRWEFRINSRGFRSTKEYDYKKPANTVRIMVLGDSYTVGYEVGQDETYSAILEKYLLQKGMQVEVINAGMSGNSNAEELVFFEQEGVKYNPDIVILGFYANDLGDNVRTNLYHFTDNQLVLNKTEYLPAIKIRNFLNSIFVYRWLSEHSYLHNFLNNVATQYFKNRLLRKQKSPLSEKVVPQKDTKRQEPPLSEKVAPQKDANDAFRYQQHLAVALVKKMHTIAKDRDIRFILLDIPRSNLVSSFPSLPDTAPSDCSDFYLNSAEILEPYNNLAKLYRSHGHGHWTPLSHLIVGKHLGEIIMSQSRGSELE